MKYLISLIIFSILIFTGCSENQNITSPNVENELSKTNDPVYGNYLNDEKDTILLDLEPVWISLPLLPSVPQGSTYFISKMIFNDIDDRIEIDTSYSGYSGGLFGQVNIKLTIKFNKQILQQDTMLVTVEINLQNSSIKFGPSAIFNEPALLDYKIMGLDFSLFDPYQIRFIYAGGNGVIEPVAFYKYVVKESEGSIELIKGEISHFSRYGFVR